MEAIDSVTQPPNNKPKNGPQVNLKGAKNTKHELGSLTQYLMADYSTFTSESSTENKKRKQLQHSADIVYTKGTSIQTMPCISKQLRGATGGIVGLQYLWEYRSPSKSVPPHYQCKLCAVSRLQHDMIAHVKGWKHCFKYLKRFHPDKISCEEEEGMKDHIVRKTIKDAAIEVEKTEGRGQIKVILREPYDVPAFKGLRSAAPKVPPPAAMGPNGRTFGPLFPDQRFPGDFPSNEGPFSDFPLGEYGASGFGGFSPRRGFSDSDMGRRQQDGMGHHQGGAGDGYGLDSGRDGFNPGRLYSDDYQGCQMGGSLLNRPVKKPLDRPGLLGAAPDTGSDPNALLNYLDTFRIENENDAQLVLKVTQKLTDLLMEFRLRSVSAGSSANILSMSSTGFSSSSTGFSSSSTGFSSSTSRVPSSSDRYSSALSSFSGASRFSSGQSRFSAAGQSRFSAGPSRY